MTIGMLFLLVIAYIVLCIVLVEIYYRSPLNSYETCFGVEHKLDSEDLYMLIIVIHIIITFIVLLGSAIITFWNVPI